MDALVTLHARAVACSRCHLVGLPSSASVSIPFHLDTSIVLKACETGWRSRVAPGGTQFFCPACVPLEGLRVSERYAQRAGTIRDLETNLEVAYGVGDTASTIGEHLLKTIQERGRR
jgi:hypothetical protein